MGEIGSGTCPSWPTTPDTNNTLEVASPAAGKTLITANTMNDVCNIAIKLEEKLGQDPQGSLTDVKTYLQTEHNTNGTHKDTLVAMLAGTQSITGTKTFTADPIISKATPKLIIRRSATGQVQGISIQAEDNSEIGDIVYIGASDEFGLGSGSGTYPFKIARSTGNMTAGIVTLARMAYITDVTFTSIGTGAYGDQTITHGLGTDNVMCILMLDGSWTNSMFMARRPDGKTAFCQVGTPTAYVLPSAPSTGQIAVRFRNESGITLTTVCRVAVLRES